MEANLSEKEQYEAYLEWIQKVRESKNVDKFLSGGVMGQEPTAEEIDEQANALIETMPQLQKQMNQMKEEEIVQIGQQYLESMKGSQQYTTLARMFAINKLGTSKLILASIYKQKSENNGNVSRSLKVARPAARMNMPPSAFGRKGLKIMEMNGHCPEGYEVVSLGLGGCVKCKKIKQRLLKEQLVQDMKCGGKKRIKKSERGSLLKAKNGLTLSRAKSLKYDGGPGDINSTQGMKPNKKQRKAMKRIGGMINGAKKIDIYEQPGMFDYIKLN